MKITKFLLIVWALVVGFPLYAQTTNSSTTVNEPYPGMLPRAQETITLCFDPGTKEEYISHYKFYVRTNWPEGMPATNAYTHLLPMDGTLEGTCNTNNVMHWTPPEGMDGWILAQTLTNLDSGGNLLYVDRVIITNRWPGSALFTVMTGVNATLESPFSNVAWIPEPVRPQKNFRLFVPKP